jgi:hypothetical protein
MKKNIFVLILAFLSSNLAFGKNQNYQSQQQNFSISTCYKSILSIINDYIAGAPKKNSGRYIMHTETERESFRLSLQKLLAGDQVTASIYADAGNYFVCRGSSKNATEKNWVFYYPKTITGEAMVIYNLAHTEKLILEVPHTFVDTNTYPQGREIFRKIQAKALIINGTHRCGHNEYNGCDGTTNVCGIQDEPYRYSDMAHNPLSPFHVAHQELSEFFPTSIVLSLHGFIYEGASLSDGTALNTTATSNSARFHKTLRKYFPGEFITTCNTYTGAVGISKRMCGTTNVQARHINKTPTLDICHEYSNTTADRFIHMEQSGILRNSTKYPTMVNALKEFLATLP